MLCHSHSLAQKYYLNPCRNQDTPKFLKNKLKTMREVLLRFNHESLLYAKVNKQIHESLLYAKMN